MLKQELLAPAGDPDAGYAALYYGADAVYLGLKRFSARATATNFDERELNELTAFAHNLNKKVYVTLNTLIQEAELPELLKTLDICMRCQIDALIVQDLGLAHIVKTYYPSLELHASTQMAVHNKEGALALQRTGYSRVVLARELTLPEIRAIAAVPHLETEAFIHGALCYCYSGLCLFSSFESGRSANRGKCLYPCRALFKGPQGEQHYFSMKDMALQQDVLKMPVTSLKIEGRKKNALYVAAVTHYYRTLLDTGRAAPVQEEHIKQIFSRPWTKFHLLGKNKDVIDRTFVGHRGLAIGVVENVIKDTLIFQTTHAIMRHDGIQIDVKGLEKPFGFSVQELKVHHRPTFFSKAGDVVEITLPPKSPFIEKGAPVYLASSMEVKGAYKFTRPKPNAYRIRPSVPVTITFTKNGIMAATGGIQVQQKMTLEPAQNTEKMTATILKVFEKYQDTDFRAEPITIYNDGEFFAPVSTLNEVRRSLYHQVKVQTITPTLPVLIERKKSSPQWILKTDQWDKLKGVDLSDFAEIIVVAPSTLDIKSLKDFPKNKIRLALPTVERSPMKWRLFIDNCIQSGFHKFEIGNVWGLMALPKTGVDIGFDSSLYMLNSQSICAAKSLGASRITLSPEDTLKNLKTLCNISPLPCTVVMYQDVPLFTSVNCLKNACSACRQTPFTMSLTKGQASYQVITKNCTAQVFAKTPFYMGDAVKQLNPDYIRLDFVNISYTTAQMTDIITKSRLFAPIVNTSSFNLNRQI